MRLANCGAFALFVLLCCLAEVHAQPAPGGPNPFALPPLPADAPRPSPDPHNLEGTWYHQDPMQLVVKTTVYGKPLPLNEKAKALLSERLSAQQAGRPLASTGILCRPPGPFWQIDINFPFTILQTPDEITFVFREYHGVWNIRMNQPHRASGVREYMGDSVGHWEGDTLVVETINYKELFWLNSDVTGAPISRDARLVHRIRKIDEEDGPALSVLTTVDDPTFSTAKWSLLRSFVWRPDQALFEEYNCESDVSRSDGVSRYGFTEASKTE